MPIPPSLTAGASIEFEAPTPGYDQADGYSGLLELVNASGKISLTSSSSSGVTHTFTAALAVSALWTAGRYTSQLSAVKSGEKWPISRGEVEIRADLGAAATLDERTHVRKVLDSIEAVIERRASSADLEVTIPNGEAGAIELKRIPLGDLMKVRDAYRRELQSLNVAAGLADGRGSSRTIRVRFTGE